MRINFGPRRYFPRHLGHDRLCAQRVYGGGPPPGPGLRGIRPEQIGERDGGDFEMDIAAIKATILAEHARAEPHLLS